MRVHVGLKRSQRSFVARMPRRRSLPVAARRPGRVTGIAGRIPLTAGHRARRGLTAMPGALPARTAAETAPNRPAPASAGSALACVRHLREEHQRRLDPLADVIGVAKPKLREDRVDVLFDGVLWSGRAPLQSPSCSCPERSRPAPRARVASAQRMESSPHSERAKTSTSTTFGSTDDPPAATDRIADTRTDRSPSRSLRR